MDDLNENERRVLVALFKESANYGHDFGVTEDVVLPEGITPRQYSGYMSQLVQKGYVEVATDDPCVAHVFMLLPKALEVE